MRIGTKLAATTVATVVLVLIVGGTSFIAVKRLIDASDWVQHTKTVLEELQAGMLAFYDATASERAYIVSGQEAYNQDFTNAAEDSLRHLKKARALVQDNPSQVQRLEVLLPMVDDKLDEYAETIRLYKTKGFDAAAEAMRKTSGHDFKEKITKLNDGVRGEELDLFETRLDELQRSTYTSQLTVILGTVLVIAFTVIVNTFLAQHILGWVKRLLRASENAEYGRFDTIDYLEHDEFSDLASVFNQLGLHLDVSKKALIEENKSREAAEDQLSAEREKASKAQEHLKRLVAQIELHCEAVDKSAREDREVMALLNDLISHTHNLESVARSVSTAINQASDCGLTSANSCGDLSTSLDLTSLKITAGNRAYEALSEYTQRVFEVAAEIDTLATTLDVITATCDLTLEQDRDKSVQVIREKLKELVLFCRQQKVNLNLSVSKVQSLTSRTVGLGAEIDASLGSTRAMLDNIGSNLGKLSDILRGSEHTASALLSAVSQQNSLLSKSRVELDDVLQMKTKQSDFIRRVRIDAAEAQKLVAADS